MAKKKLLRLAVIDDHPAMRRGLCTLLMDWPHGTVVLEAADGVDYEEQVATTGPMDLVVVDLRMPRRDGFATIAWIREHQPEARILAITYEPTDDMVYHALQAGAHGVVGKDIDPADLLAALDALRTTGHYANPLMMRQLTHVPDGSSPLALRKKLTDALAPRESEFLLLYIDDANHSRHAVARLMKISVNTAETYRKNIVEKTAARTRVAMVKMAIRFGLIRV